MAVIRTGARKGKLIYLGRAERAAPVTGVGIKKGRRGPSWSGELYSRRVALVVVVGGTHRKREGGNQEEEP